MITQKNITALRMKHQYLSEVADEKACDSLFDPVVSPVKCWNGEVL